MRSLPALLTGRTEIRIPIPGIGRTAIALLVLSALCPAWAGRPVDAYIQRVMKLAEAHKRGVARLTEPARRTGEALLAGGAFWLAGRDAGWIEEGELRSGGTARAAALRSIDRAGKGDVVWLSFSPETYEADSATAATLERKGCVVVAFGPRPPGGCARTSLLVDSLTRWNEAPDLTLLGNVLSLWSLTGEVAAYTARHGKTLSMLQSVGVVGGRARLERYGKTMFHDESGPQMQPAGELVFARAYLNYIGRMFREIRDGETDKLVRAGVQIRRGAEQSRAAYIGGIGHLITHVLPSDGALFKKIPRSSPPARSSTAPAAARSDPQLEEALRGSSALVWLGYTSVPQEMAVAARNAGVQAIWVVASDDKPADPGRDIVIDQHWTIGDAAVEAPGYDIKILPPSSLAQLFIWEILARSVAPLK